MVMTRPPAWLCGSTTTLTPECSCRLYSLTGFRRHNRSCQEQRQLICECGLPSDNEGMHPTAQKEVAGDAQFVRRRRNRGVPTCADVKIFPWLTKSGSPRLPNDTSGRSWSLNAL